MLRSFPKECVHFARELITPWRFVQPNDASLVVVHFAIPPQDYPSGAHLVIGTGERGDATHPVSDAVTRYGRYGLAGVAFEELVRSAVLSPPAATDALRFGHCVRLERGVHVAPRVSFFGAVMTSKNNELEASDVALKVHVFGLLTRSR